MKLDDAPGKDENERPTVGSAKSGVATPSDSDFVKKVKAVENASAMYQMRKRELGTAQENYNNAEEALEEAKKEAKLSLPGWAT